MEPAIRFGRQSDLPAFELALRSYLLEQRKTGSPVRVTRQTVDFYRGLCENYLRGSLFGFLILAEEAGRLVGFVLVGEDTGPPRLDTALGREAAVWLAWVAEPFRKTGLGIGMLRFGLPRAVELGFETATMTVREENQEGLALCRAFGARVAERLLIFPVREESDGRQ